MYCVPLGHIHLPYRHNARHQIAFRISFSVIFQDSKLGVPGNGKTVTIKALINSLTSRAEPILSLYVKTSTHAIAQNDRSKQSSPKLEIRLRAFSFSKTDATGSYFLTEVDGLKSNDLVDGIL